MNRYWITLAFVCLVLFLASVFAFLSSSTESPDDFLISMTVFWSVISVSSFFALLSVWGLAGLWLSRLREYQEQISIKDFEISKKSWHYRLNTWANGGSEPIDVRGECEYWARLFHGLSLIPFLYAIFIAIAAIIAIVRWLFSARVNVAWFKPSEIGPNRNLFKEGRQPVGPVIFLIITIGLLALLVPHGFWTGMPWTLVGLITGLTIAGLALLVGFGLLVWKVIWPLGAEGAKAVQPIFTYPIVRAARLCRPTKYVD